MQRIEDDDDLSTLESIERRREPRGVYPGLAVFVRQSGLSGELPVPEASRNTFFAEFPTPDTFGLGSGSIVELRYKDKAASLEVRVVRKEIHPRHGIVFQLVGSDAGQLQRYHDLLGFVDGEE